MVLMKVRTVTDHYVGRMGYITDPMAVVDSEARVISVNSLRVVDASSFALLPPGHPQSTVCDYSKIFFRTIRQNNHRSYGGKYLR